MNKVQRFPYYAFLFILVFFGLGTTNISHAGKTYTPAQLRSMTMAGNYPKQGKPSTKSQSIDYASCLAKVASVIDSIRLEYPTSTIVNTKILRIEKVWTNDAAMTFSCSELDRKLVITTAQYI